MLFHRRRRPAASISNAKPTSHLPTEETTMDTDEVGTIQLPGHDPTEIIQQGADPAEVQPAAPEIQAALARLALVPEGLVTPALAHGLVAAAETAVYHRQVAERIAAAQADLAAAQGRQDVAAATSAQATTRTR